jgi:hypothetical protein
LEKVVERKPMKLNSTPRQVRIFPPPRAPYHDPGTWAETLIGRVIKPFVEACGSNLEWFWFLRYGSPWIAGEWADAVRAKCPRDFGVKVAPPTFETVPAFESVGTEGTFRSLRFRYQFQDARLVLGLEKLLLAKIRKEHCWASGCLDYPLVGNLGDDDRRFCAPDAHITRRVERAHLVSDLLHATSRLVCDAIVPAGEGRFRLESTNNRHNGNGSFFESVLHLFANCTNVEPLVHINLSYGSIYYPRDERRLSFPVRL